MSPEVTTFRPAALHTAAPVDEATRAAGHAAGWAAGWAAGARAAAERAAAAEAGRAAEHARAESLRQAVLDEAVASLLRAAQAADRRALPAVEQVRRELTTAALTLAEAVLGHELADGSTSARAAMSRALAAPADLGVHTVRLNPADVAAVEDLVASGEIRLEGVAVVADASLRRGDAISEHPTGFLDAQLSTALGRARRVLLGEDA
ncbi:FliH/SctL family protein [Actinotalea sp.]|uniref:FliH/SctL family protein n=1 Tax=Actinotalea sp. TaxID=1872145 RepID=UPI003569933D